MKKKTLQFLIFCLMGLGLNFHANGQGCPFSGSSAPTVCTQSFPGTISVVNTPSGSVTWTQIAGPGAVTINPVGPLFQSAEITGTFPGPVTIQYMDAGGPCTWTMNVLPSNPVSQITPSVTAVCAGTPVLYNEPASGGTPGGTWSISAPIVASIASTGPLTAQSATLAGGTATVTYTTPSLGGCSSFSTASLMVEEHGTSINPASPDICATGGPIPLMNGGYGPVTWAIIGTTGSATGTVSGTSPTSAIFTPLTGGGTVTVEYTLSPDACSTIRFTTTDVITIDNPIPAFTVTPATTGSISGLGYACTSGSTSTDVYTASYSGSLSGAWSSSNTSVATVSGGGGTSTTATAGVAGTANISFSVSNGCGTQSAGAPIDVQNVPVAPAPISTSPAGLCQGSTFTFTDGTPGGYWTSSNSSKCSINPSTGLATASSVSTGAVTIFYNVANDCSPAILPATAVFNVDAPPAITPASSPAICATAGSAPFALTTSGDIQNGTWSASNTLVSLATFSHNTTCTATAAGTAGTSILTYTPPAATCATGLQSSVVIIINQDPATSYTGPNFVCEYGNTTLRNAVPGYWVPGLGAYLDVIDSAGDVYGITAGPQTVTYMANNACTGGVYYPYNYTVPVVSAPNPGMISSSPLSIGTPICVGDPTTVCTSGGAPGGTWSISNPMPATITPLGYLTATTTPLNAGTAIVSYTTPAGGSMGCISTTTLVVVVEGPPLNFSGSNQLCQGSSETVAVTGGCGFVGNWTAGTDLSILSSSNTTVDVNGVTAGSTYVSYNITSIPGCSTFPPLLGYGITVLPQPGLVGITETSGPVPYAYVTSSGTTDPTVSYQLCYFSGLTPVSYIPAQIGTGSTLTFGPITSADLYCLVGTSTVTGCSKSSSSLSVTRNSNSGGGNPQPANLAQLELIPNPTSGIFTISGSAGYMANATEVKIEVTDIMGRAVYTGTAPVTNGSVSANVSLEAGVAGGLYLVRLSTTDGSSVLRLSVTK